MPRIGVNSRESDVHRTWQGRDRRIYSRGSDVIAPGGVGIVGCSIYEGIRSWQLSDRRHISVQNGKYVDLLPTPSSGIPLTAP